MKDYDAYLFDWDGTLAATLEVWLGIHRAALGKYGEKISDETIVDVTFGRMFDGARDLGVPEDELDEVRKIHCRLGREKVPNSPLFPYAKEMLESLKARGKKVALLSTNYREVIDIVLSHHELLNLFDLVVSGDDVKKAKPDPEGILFCLEKLGVAKGKALMLGDGDKDLGAANNAGVDSLLFFPPTHKIFYDLHKLQQEFHPTYTISSWHELI